MTEETIQYLPLAKITTDDNIRKVISKEQLHGLMESLRAVGQLQPIRVRLVGSVFKTTDGARRVLAARQAGWERIGAIVDDGEESPADTIEKQLVANIQREDMRPSERAAAIEKLIELRDLTASAAAARLGMSGGSVTRLLAVLKLPEPIRRRIDASEIPASAGYELAKMTDPAEQSALADQLATGKVTRDALSGAIKARRRDPQEVAVVRTRRVVVPLDEGRTVTVSGASSLEALIEVGEELLAKARKARTQGLTLPTFLKVRRETKA